MRFIVFYNTNDIVESLSETNEVKVSLLTLESSSQISLVELLSVCCIAKRRRLATTFLFSYKIYLSLISIVSVEVQRNSFQQPFFTSYIEACEVNRWEKNVMMMGLMIKHGERKRQKIKAFCGCMHAKMNEYI